MVDTFIEYDEVKSLTNLSDGAMVGGVRYRKRPKDTGCLHTHADYPMSREAMRLKDTVEVVCLEEGCGMRWLVVPEVVT